MCMKQQLMYSMLHQDRDIYQEESQYIGYKELYQNLFVHQPI